MKSPAKKSKGPAREFPGRAMVTALVPVELISRLDALATAERRSRSSQLVRLLEVALGDAEHDAIEKRARESIQ